VHIVVVPYNKACDIHSSSL